MKIIAETDRLILREVESTDKEAFFILDADPEVHRFLGNKPVTTITEAEQMIEFIKKQYIDNGIGRWAVIDKKTNDFMGWSGLKYITELTNNHIGYYDIGYRLIRKYWGRGYATESAEAALDYGFEQLRLLSIYGIADTRNMASRHVLEKIGLIDIEEFILEGESHRWLELTRNNWMNKKKLSQE
ncbi:GNAT family N-acetyltransferase [Pedobacter sp. AW31-3R]|uniref:GNAT family N-acetyltransferase n=1 Tax=Pedobacter sp. AW31-3R TaxID=3445781 RepID=UPI003F9F4CAB